MVSQQKQRGRRGGIAASCIQVAFVVFNACLFFQLAGLSKMQHYSILPPSSSTQTNEKAFLSFFCYYCICDKKEDGIRGWTSMGKIGVCHLPTRSGTGSYSSRFNSLGTFSKNVLWKCALRDSRISHTNILSPFFILCWLLYFPDDWTSHYNIYFWLALRCYQFFCRSIFCFFWYNTSDIA